MKCELEIKGGNWESRERKKKGKGGEYNRVPRSVILFGSGSKGDAYVSDPFSTNAGTASHKLIHMNSHFLVVPQLSIQPVCICTCNAFIHFKFQVSTNQYLVEREGENERNKGIKGRERYVK